MSFPKYPAYKDSGVEWLGEVPEHWVMGSLKNMAQIRNGKDYKAVESSDGEYPVIGSGGQFSNATQYLYEGESVLLGRKGTIDKPLYINGRFWTVDTMFYTEISKGACAKFFYYNSLTIPFDYYSTSTALPSMTQADLLNHPAAIPTKLEQTQIARFLDHETARIDALIEEQQRLIELLKEKRQAMISHAVTKGLDPTVPMKDSGVEWLGEVPAHWDVKALRRVLKESLSNGVFKKKEDFGRGVLLVNVFDVYRPNFQVNYSSLDRVDCNAAEISSYSVLPGDLFFVRSSLKYEGIAVVAVAGECSEPVVYECHLICARPDPAVFNGRYGSYLFNSSNYRAAMISKSKLTTMTTIDQEAISSTLIPTPPLSEQAEISVFLDREINKVDQLIGEAYSVCELLKERRSALISAAVTGKIDIRGWQQPTSAQAPELEVAEAV
ncbi:MULTISPECIES: restriction endonuclease subunit S [Stutzerimonas]|uniref:Restriction endonuclease subunit S n=1 Tax=Stutzerimonas nitrititolerans TaxID=2482751 RepID=A0AA41WJ32_9GAMM|nr:MULTISPECIES: restriction endonuclease subunit S [Stutzerimonas]MCO7546404.1 restriction endonuclease subunit S [Stutzerimonas nitrititolerans]